MEQMNFEQAWKFLDEKGLSLSEKMNVRNAFYEAAKQLTNVYKDGDFWENKNVPGYGFTTEEEAEFSEHLFEYLSAFTTAKKIEMLKIINRLCDMPSEWKY